MNCCGWWNWKVALSFVHSVLKSSTVTKPLLFSDSLSPLTYLQTPTFLPNWTCSWITSWRRSCRENKWRYSVLCKEQPVVLLLIISGFDSQNESKNFLSLNGDTRVQNSWRGEVKSKESKTSFELNLKEEAALPCLLDLIFSLFLWSSCFLLTDINGITVHVEDLTTTSRTKFNYLMARAHANMRNTFINK